MGNHGLNTANKNCKSYGCIPINDPLINKVIIYYAVEQHFEDHQSALNFLHTLKKECGYRDDNSLHKNIDIISRELGIKYADFAREHEYVADSFKKLDPDTVVIYRGSPLYPHLLSDTDQDVPFLFANGDLSLLNETSASIIGGKKNGQNILKWTENLIRDLSLHNVVITYGAEKYTEKMALSTAANYNEKTIAVLDSPIIQQKRQQGLVLSQFSPSARAKQTDSVKRDKLLCAISGASIVMSYDNSGQTLKLANNVLRHDRALCFPEYLLKSPAGDSFQQLLNRGAQHFRSASDILPALTGIPNGDCIVFDNGLILTGVGGNNIGEWLSELRYTYEGVDELDHIYARTYTDGILTGTIMEGDSVGDSVHASSLFYHRFGTGTFRYDGNHLKGYIYLSLESNPDAVDTFCGTYTQADGFRRIGEKRNAEKNNTAVRKERHAKSAVKTKPASKYKFKKENLDKNIVINDFWHNDGYLIVEPDEPAHIVGSTLEKEHIITTNEILNSISMGESNLLKGDLPCLQEEAVIERYRILDISPDKLAAEIEIETVEMDDTGSVSKKNTETVSFGLSDGLPESTAILFNNGLTVSGFSMKNFGQLFGSLPEFKKNGLNDDFYGIVYSRGKPAAKFYDDEGTPVFNVFGKGSYIIDNPYGQITFYPSSNDYVPIAYGTIDHDGEFHQLTQEQLDEIYGFDKLIEMPDGKGYLLRKSDYQSDYNERSMIFDVKSHEISYEYA